jgi:hypothetical protein
MGNKNPEIKDVEPLSENVDDYMVLDKENIKIALRRNDGCCDWSIIQIIDEKEYIINLEKEGIPQKQPELMWANDDFACFMTWWSQSLSIHVFIPLKKGNKMIYLDKDIKEMDTINNNIVYVDTVADKGEKVIFAVENLLSRKSKKAYPIIINEKNGVYPFYESIIMTKEKVKILTRSNNQTINIKEIY